MSAPPSPGGVSRGPDTPSRLPPPPMSPSLARRPGTTGMIASARTRTPASGRTNRRASSSFHHGSDVTANNTTSSGGGGGGGRASKTTGQWALSTTQSSGRPVIESLATSPSVRRLETATLGRGHVGCLPKDWITEQKEKMRPPLSQPKSFAETMVDLNEEKEENLHHAYARYNADKARRKLQRLVNHQFAGSVDMLFGAADTDGDGQLDFEEFSAMLKRTRLEQFFGRKEQRDIFRAVDTEDSEVVSMARLVDFLKADASFVGGGTGGQGGQLAEGGGSRDSALWPTVERQPVALNTPKDDAARTNLSALDASYAANLNATQGSEMTFTTAPSQRTPAQERKKQAEEARVAIVNKLNAKRSEDKNEDGHVFTSEFALKAFRQNDGAMSGSLSRDELAHVLGPKWLDLNVSPAELDAFVSTFEVEDPTTGKVAYGEFIKALKVHDMAPAFDPVLEARERGLKRMKDRMKETPPPEQHRLYLDARAKADELLRESAEASASKLRATRELARETRDGAADMRATLPNDWSMGADLAPVPRLPGPGSATRAGGRGGGGPSSRVGSGPELFADLARISAAVRAATGKKHGGGMREHHSWDNSRVGLGSHGVDPSSGLYAPPTERFATTSVDYHAPLMYEPNQPVVRPSGKCDSAADAAARAQRRQARFARSTQNQLAAQDNAKREDAFRALNLDQRERRAAKQAYGYYRKAYFKDLKLHAKEPLEVMAKQPSWPAFAKTYSCSPASQLHDMLKQPDKRDMRTVYGLDLGNGHGWAPGMTGTPGSDSGASNPRFSQTAFALQGGVLPDLHRTTMRNRW